MTANPQVDARPDQALELPVVLTPGDPADIRRLADALRTAPRLHPTPDDPAGDIAYTERAAGILAALVADDTVDACIWCGCPTTGDTTHHIDGDLLAEVIANACPGVLSDDASRRTAEHAVAQLAQIDGVTVVRGPGREPWQPDMPLPTAATRTAGNARLIAELATRDRTLSELRAELRHVKGLNATQQRLAGTHADARADRNAVGRPIIAAYVLALALSEDRDRG